MSREWQEHWQDRAACAGENPGPWDHDTVNGSTAGDMLTMTESLIVAAVLLALLALLWGRLVDWVRRTADRDWSATLDDRAHMWDGRPGGES